MLRRALLLLPLVAVSMATFRWAFPFHYKDILISPLVTSFSCEGRYYGYYADVDNNCQVYHVCYPLYDASGTHISTFHFSFICGNATVFSQDRLTCTSPEDAYPCEDSPSLYDVINAQFGIEPELELDVK